MNLRAKLYAPTLLPEPSLNSDGALQVALAIFHQPFALLLKHYCISYKKKKKEKKFCLETAGRSAILLLPFLVV